MKLKATYVVLLALFYVSIPVMQNLTEIVFWVRGHDQEVALEATGVPHNEERNARFYDAYTQEGPLIALASRSIVAIWILAFIFSAIVSRKRISLPFRLEIITGVISFVLILGVMLPIIVFGRGWPPRPF